MDKAIRDFYKQFTYEPVLENGGSLANVNTFVVCGMGGSHLAAGLVKAWNPYLDIIIHRDYGLPAISEGELKTSLIIASSYSGNTEEVLDSFDKARKRRLPLAAVAIGGKLLELAKKHTIPYVQMPDTGIQPRSALGFSIRALLRIMGQDGALEELKDLAPALNSPHYEKEGKALAGKLKGFVPVIYTSTRNQPVAYNWKIKLNETGKIPAFYNVFPELNHNEMTGFDVNPSSKKLSERFYFLILSDEADHLQVQKRMKILKGLYEGRSLKVELLPLKGKSVFEKMFSSLLLADWTAFYTAQNYGLESEKVPMVEEFKKMIAM